MAVTGRTAGGLAKVRALRPGSRMALVAPASPFERDAFESGCRELARLGLDPVFDERVFEREAIVAGDARLRADLLSDAWIREDVDAVMAVRGGYGSMELLPLLTSETFVRRPIAFVGYSDTTSLHSWLNGHVGIASIHGPMIDGRLAVGETAYDVDSLLASLGDVPIGELSPPGLEVVTRGEATGPLVGGTLTQLCASLGTPYDFRPPAGAVLFIDEVGERPYRLRRLLVQLVQSGRLRQVVAVVFGQLPRCDEPDGRLTARHVVEWFAREHRVPVLYGFPSGHTTTPLITLPFGVATRVVASGRPCVVLEEAAAE